MVKIYSILILIVISQTVHAQTVDEMWDEVSRTVQAGDFEGYAAVYHPDAVLVNGTSGESYPISEALAGWKKGFDDTKAGKMKAGVEFRIAKRLSDETTAHDTGIFRYYYTPEGSSEEVSSLVHFQALMVKKNGEWKMVMEYQMEEASIEEWEDLAVE